MDWLAVACLWLGAAILAIKGADLKAMPGAPVLITTELWRYAPILLVTLAAIITAARAFSPRPSPTNGATASATNSAHPREPFLDAWSKRQIVGAGCMAFLTIVIWWATHTFGSH